MKLVLFFVDLMMQLLPASGFLKLKRLRCYTCLSLIRNFLLCFPSVGSHVHTWYLSNVSLLCCGGGSVEYFLRRTLLITSGNIRIIYSKGTCVYHHLKLCSILLPQNQEVLAYCRWLWQLPSFLNYTIRSEWKGALVTKRCICLWWDQRQRQVARRRS